MEGRLRGNCFEGGVHEWERMRESAFPSPEDMVQSQQGLRLEEGELAGESVLVALGSQEKSSDVFEGFRQPEHPQIWSQSYAEMHSGSHSHQSMEGFNEQNHGTGDMEETLEKLVGFLGGSEDEGPKEAARRWEVKQAMELEEFAAAERQIERECGEINAHSRIPKGNPQDTHQNGLVRDASFCHEPQGPYNIEFDDHTEWTDSGHVDCAHPSQSTGHGLPSSVPQDHNLPVHFSQDQMMQNALHPEAPTDEEIERTEKSVSLVQSLFKKGNHRPPLPVRREPERSMPPETEQKVQQLSNEIEKFQKDHAAIMRIKKDLDASRRRLDEEKAAWEKLKERENHKFETLREDELRKLKKERKALEQRSRDLVKLPNRKERSEIEAVEAILQQERKDIKAKEGRHKLTVERLRQQIIELQRTNSEQREEIQWHEKQQIEAWEAVEKLKAEKRSKSSKHKSIQTAPISETNGVPVSDKPAIQSNMLPEDTMAGQQLSSRNEKLGIGDDIDENRPVQGTPDYGQSIQSTAWEQEVYGQQVHPSQDQRAQIQFDLSDPTPVWSPNQGHESRISYAQMHATSHPYNTTHPVTIGRTTEQDSFTNLGLKGPEQQGGQIQNHNHCPQQPFQQTRASGVQRCQRLGSSLDPSMAAYGGENAGTTCFQRASSQAVLYPGQHQDHCVPPPTLSQDPQFGLCNGAHRGNQIQRPHHRLEQAGFDVNVGPAQGVGWSGYPFVDASNNHHVLQETRFPKYAEVNGSAQQIPQALSSSMRPRQSTVVPVETCMAGSQASHEQVYMRKQQHGYDQMQLRGAQFQVPQMEPGKSQASKAPHKFPQAPQNAISGGIPHSVRDAVVVKEVRAGKGKLEQLLSDGRKLIKFTNGSLKEILQDGTTNIVFANGDAKRAHVNGIVEYYYCSVDTWQTTHPNGAEVFYFSSGQKEAHHTNGEKEILFPDGVVQIVDRNGQQREKVGPESLSKQIQLPKPKLPMVCSQGC